MVIPFLQTSTFTGLISTSKYGTSADWYSLSNLTTVLTSLIFDTTYTELTSLKANNNLKKGVYYRITDFRLKWWNQSSYDVTVKEGLCAEPLLVFTLSSNKISYEARSELYPQDIIYYDVDAKSSYTWGNININEPIPNFKGWITRRVDTINHIDIEYDWRNITVNCCRPDLTSVGNYNAGTTYNLYDFIKNNNKLYFSLKNNNTGNSINDTETWMPATDFVEGLTYFPTDEVFGLEIYGPSGQILTLNADLATRIQQPTFTSSLVSQGIFQLTNCNNIKIAGGFCNIFLGNNIYSNIIEQECKYNIIKNNFYKNIIANNFSNNYIGNNFIDNDIENNFEQNSIGSNFEFNAVENNFLQNTVNNTFSRNIVNNDFQNNIINLQFDYNIVRGNFTNNNIGTYFENNEVSQGFLENTVMYNFNNNTIKQNFSYNTIEDEFANNYIGNNFIQNVVGSEMQFNIIQENFDSNIIGDGFQLNNIQNKAAVGIDFTTATHVYDSYNKTIFLNSDLVSRLSYFNSGDQLVVTDPTV